MAGANTWAVARAMCSLMLTVMFPNAAGNKQHKHLKFLRFCCRVIWKIFKTMWLGFREAEPGGRAALLLKAGRRLAF